MAETLGVKFDIDITKLEAGLRSANKRIRESESQFKAAAAGMDDWSKSEEGLKARISSLNEITAVQREKVRALKENYQKLINEGLDPTSDRAVQLRTQINNEEAALARNEQELKKNTEALEQLGDEAEETGKDIEKTGVSFEKFVSLAKGACKVAVAALAAVGAGVIALSKKAIENYADYEQLVGGVETLFGAGGQSLEEYAKSVGKSVDAAKGEYNKLLSAQDTMIKNAANAYETAGMSANEYIENVTGFSAALIASLDGDTQKAAAAANRAMIDISDNANKMGTDMQSIVGTYQSLAKGNFQMLDNLKLGYGGTKTEMQRLIKDASKLKDVQKELNVTVKEGDMSFANMVNAISVVQSKMGIAGTTAKEAGSTITGSLNMTRAAWQNLLTGIADDNQDFDLLINNFVDALGKAMENLLPRVSVALNGVIKLIEKLVPQLPSIIEQILPVLTNGIVTIVQGLVKVLPTIIDAIMEVVPQLVKALIDMLPTILSTLVELVVKIINALTEMIPTSVDAIIQVIPLLINSLIEATPQLLEAAIQLLTALIDAIPVIVTAMSENLPTIIDTIINTLLDNMPMLINASIQLFMALLKAIPVVIVQLIKNIPTIITSIIGALTSPEALKGIANAGVELIKGLWNGIKSMSKWIWEKIQGFGKGVLDGLKSFFGIHSPSTVMENIIGKNLALGIGKGFEENIAGVNKEIQSAMNFESPTVNVRKSIIGGETDGRYLGNGQVVNVYQTNNYSQAHSRYEIYKSKQQTAAAVRLAMGTV